MNEGIVFYHNPMSRGRVVHWMLEELGEPYTVRLLSLEKGEHKRPEYLSINPMGKIPAIVHRDTVITEVAAICTYLADAFPKANLAPALDDPARGTYLRWIFFTSGCVEPAMTDRSLSRAVPEKAGMVGYGTYEDTMNALEKAITPGPYILGQRFSAADVFVGSMINWGMMVKSLESRPAFQAYGARLNDRPAARRSAAQDEKLMAELRVQATS